MTPGMIELLKEQEGYRKMPYKDSEGVLTIGYGTNLEDGLEKFEAEALMLAYIHYLERTVPNYVKGWWFMDSTRRDVVINMSYNLGLTRFLEFKGFLAALARQDYIDAADHMLNSKWSKQVGDRAIVLSDIMRGYSVKAA